MILIYTALLCEAQTFIEQLKLKKINSNPKIYTNDSYIVLIGGIGKENTLNSLDYIYKNYKIKKAINIGIAGISNISIEIGTLFCCTHQDNDIRWLPLKTVDIVQEKDNVEDNCLYDMEGKYFYDISLNVLNKKDIYIYKIVSDHLCRDILSKDFIKKLVKDVSYKIIKKDSK